MASPPTMTPQIRRSVATLPRWRRIVASWLQPVVVLGALAIWFALRSLGWSSFRVSFALIVAATGIVAAFEWILPARPDWRPTVKQVRIDALYLVALFTVVPWLLGLAKPARGAIVHALGPFVPHGVWPSRAPLLVKIALALLLSEFFAYWLHRAQHRIGLLWRFHATHHVATRLNWWKGPVNHPLELYFLDWSRRLPLLLLGAGMDELVGSNLLWTILSLFAHGNIALRPGVFGRVFCTSEYHVRHHALDIATSRSNYGDALIVWDRLFGTFRDQGPEAWNAPLGIDAGADVPLVQQLALPFRRRP